MATIYVRELHVLTLIGVKPRERVDKQEVVLNLALEADIAAAAASDDIAETIDYSEVAARVIEHVEQARCFLLETLAVSVADTILEAFPRVEATTVTIDKPGISFARSAAVEVRKSR
ncbi:MAG: dihydroneopterin aldolase [Planctomycetota bacterium]